MDDYPEANARHYRFMLEGLTEVATALERRRIRFVPRRGAPDAVAIALAGKAVVVVCDRGYLRHQKAWRRNVADEAGCRVEHDAGKLSIDSEDPLDPDALPAQLNLDRSVAPVHSFRGGTGEAKRIFRRFLDKRFSSYQENRNQPQTDDVSHMSKYLHFGQVSPVWLALQVRAAAPASNENRDAFIEELIVRRELAINFCEFADVLGQ